MDCFSVQIDPHRMDTMSNLALAHIGDGVFELLVRTWLCLHGGTNAKTLHRETVRRVSAPAQAEAMERLLPLLTERETEVYRRGRNAKVHSVPHSATLEQYHAATGLEALFGWLYLTGQRDRISELFDRVIGGDGYAT